ncbi:hypothetical protein OPV22_026271 [Ensete ventricosum]|uniref:Histidine-containing phosphotransfer protein n=1 Tax=Ensete ventricosum TaxID=4639 RepID=A0AAV8QEX7_ENSVE|nr:hypothetical protein OPV22_026271 [Ensete ventricosum]
MDNASGLQRQLACMKKKLFDQGFLDEQFYQLEELQDESSPNFVEEVVTLFFRDSSRLMANIDQALEQCPPDFHRLDKFLHRLKGSASSIGAGKMKNECAGFREFCSEENLEGCFSSLNPRSTQLLPLLFVHASTLVQMPEIVSEGEEGAHHLEAEVGELLPVAEASRPRRQSNSLW